MAEDPVIRIVTHDGPFHGDDVVAVAILTTLFPSHTVIRTRDPTVIDLGDFVVDVGNVYDHVTRRYDHHMANPPYGMRGHIYSSAGLIWFHYGREYLRKIGIPEFYRYKGHDLTLVEEVKRHITYKWMNEIDRHDNGLSNGPTAVTEVVSALAPIMGEKTREVYDRQFLEAVAMVSHILKRVCFHDAEYCISKWEYRFCSKDYFGEGKIFVTDKEIRQFGNFSLDDIHFVIYPIHDFDNPDTPKYIIRPIYQGVDKQYRTPIPKHLLAKNEDDLIALGYEDILFVHHSGFMVRARTRQAAIDFCLMLLETDLN